MGCPLLIQQEMPTCCSSVVYDSFFSFSSYSGCIVVFDYKHLIIINIYFSPIQQQDSQLKQQMKQAKKPSHLSISIQDPKLSKQYQKQSKTMQNNKKEKQLQAKQKAQIDSMQNQIRKLTNKIDSERHLLQNRMLAQQFQFQIKKHQIAAQMSKRQIILRRLQIIRGVNQQQKSIQKAKKNNAANAKYNNVSFQLKKQKLQQISQQKQRANSNNSKKSINKQKLLKNTFQNNHNQAIRLQSIKRLVQKQKTYGNRVWKQYVNNRSKSALNYLEVRKMEQLRQLQKQRQRQKILEQIKKPSIPIKVNAPEDRRRQVDRIRSSSQPIQKKLALLNYLSQVQLSRINRKQVGGKQQDLQTLNHINRIRTSILLGRE